MTVQRLCTGHIRNTFDNEGLRSGLIFNIVETQFFTLGEIQETENNQTISMTQEQITNAVLEKVMPRLTPYLYFFTLLYMI